MDDELLLSRAREERKKIFERYEKGRSADNDIDPWEDPAYEIYHQTDKYNFLFEIMSNRHSIYVSNNLDMVSFMMREFNGNT